MTDKEIIEGSDKRYYFEVFMNTVILYFGLGCLSALWYFIYFDHWWPTYLIGFLGYFFVQLFWLHLWDARYYSRDFWYSVDEKVIYSNGVFMRRADQAYIFPKKHFPWDVDTEKLEKLPVVVYYNIFGKAIDRRVNIHISQLQQTNR